jgi:hypothetical protein
MEHNITKGNIYSSVKVLQIQLVNEDQRLTNAEFSS